VINVVLKQQFKQGSANITTRAATAGQGLGANGNASMLQLNGNSFRNFSLQASRTERMLEAHRGIVSDPGVVPYDLLGNVLSYPVAGADIDPVLSAQLGYPVTVLGIPLGTGNPTLDDLVTGANLANTSDMGRYRTLVGDQYSYGFNMNMSQPLPKNSGFSFNLNAQRSESRSRTGATPMLLTVPASSPYSPFSRDVSIARYLGEPLRQESEPTNLNFSGNINTQRGKWRMSLDSSFTWRSSTTVSERRVNTAPLQDAILAGTLNPFGDIPDEYLDEVLVDRAKSRGYNSSAQMQATGSPFKMPAGNANASLRLSWVQNRQKSTTTGTNNVRSDRTREDQLAFASLQMPLLGSPTARNKSALGGELSATARRVTGSGTLIDYNYGLNWRMGTRFTLQGNIGNQKIAPQPQSLTDPVVTIDGFRAYDFIRDETVLVRYITGGNPDLDTERRRSTRISGTLRPWVPVDLTFNAEYQRNVSHDAVSSLPPVSEDVQAAFPDRYRRDLDGRLYEIDARLVSFARSQNETLRWGANFRRAFAVPKVTAPPPSGITIILSDDSLDLTGAGWRLSGNFTHTWLMSSTRLAREGLPVVNLLSGGTSGYNASSRHSVQGRVGLAHNGTGLQANLNWKNASTISGGTASAPNNIEFSPFLRLDVSAFSNLDTLFPGKPYLKGVRVTLGIDNLFDSMQRVRDQNGDTPLRYQPYLLNPTGRVIGLSLRKNF
jgi:iron complex outermembrane recepter protein